MQIRYEKTGEVEHVSNEVGRFAIKTGLATEVIPVPTTVQAKKGPNTTWAAVRGQISGDYEEQPFIYHHCGTCGIVGSSTGRTAHITQQIRHCGVVERPPQNVVEKYVELWNKREKRKRKSKPLMASSNLVDKELAAIRGVKTHEQLVVDLQADIAMAETKK